MSKTLKRRRREEVEDDFVVKQVTKQHVISERRRKTDRHIRQALQTRDVHLLVELDEQMDY